MRKNEELKKIIKEHVTEYKALAEGQREERLLNMTAGQTVPPFLSRLDNDRRTALKDSSADRRDKAHAIIDPDLAKLRGKMTEAPDAETLAVLNALSMRKNITQAEFDEIVDKYGANPIAYNTLKDLGSARDVHVRRPNKIADELDRLEALSDQLDKTLTSYAAEEGHATEGFAALVGMMVDDVYPAGE